jgi:hypothetical protein
MAGASLWAAAQPALLFHKDVVHLGGLAVGGRILHDEFQRAGEGNISVQRRNRDLLAIDSHDGALLIVDGRVGYQERQFANPCDVLRENRDLDDRCEAGRLVRGGSL